MRQLLEDLLAGNNIRATLSGIRSQIKDDEKRADFIELLGDRISLVIDQLSNDDAKTRKNAALLLGDMEYDGAKQALYEAYTKENTLFVKESYITALTKLNVEELLPDIRDRLEELSKQEVTEDNQKHLDEEIRAIRKLLIKYEGISEHTFVGYDKSIEVILTCNKSHREIVRRQFGDSAKAHPLGVIVDGLSVEELLKVRCFREIIIPVDTHGLLPQDPLKVADALIDSEIVDGLQKLHRENSPFYYRIEYRSNQDLEKRSDFTKKLSVALDKKSQGSLINSTGDYEVEIRLISNKEGKIFAGIKLSTIRDNRFNYRKNSIAASIHPSTAALIMELAKPYLVEHAQIMDPFCGVGTMLIERNYCVNAKEIYGTDIFGEAIEKARENTDITGMNINYIHRDFFDFKHDYKFDEIITNMPIRGKKTREEMDSLYSDFFNKAGTLLADSGVIIMYTNEAGFVKKNLRMHKEYKLLQETLMLSKGEYYLMIIGFRKREV